MDDADFLKSPLIGRWNVLNGRVVEDEACKLIDQVVSNRFRLIGRDGSGWDTAYVDPETGVFWELIFPDAQLHGGGPKTLRVVDVGVLLEKYGLLKDGTQRLL